MEKILPSDLVNKGVIGLPDTPGLDTTQMQQKFDEIALDVIIPHYNDLIDELEETILPATGDMKKSVYDTDNDGKVDSAEVADDATTVNSHTVESDVPADAVFTDTTYTAGDNISIDENNEISATDTTYTAGTNVSISEQNVISATDTTYTAGSNVSISAENVISATDTTYQCKSAAEGGSDVSLVYTGEKYEWNNKMDKDGSGAAPDVTFGGTLTVGARKSGETVGIKSASFGNNNVASANMSFVEGFGNTASGIASHAEGSGNTASGAGSHAEGSGTIAGYAYQHVQGKYNDNKSDTYFEIGNGTSSSVRNNAFEVYSDGSLSQDNGTTKFLFTEVSGEKGYYDENGTFNAFGSGGGGSSTLAGLTDVTITTPSDGEILKYNSTSSKWENGTETAQIQADWNQADNTAKDYIKNKPTIPDAQIQSDWTQADNTKKDYIKNKPTLATVATSGSYADLSNKPTIPDEISELGDVSISSLTNGQILKYNSTSQKWENSAAGGGGDMQASTYDPNGTVATAGGIVAYIDATITAALTASY